MIKLIASDLDGTLLDASKQINDRDRAAVARAIGEGLELCIASGRMYAEINAFMRPFKGRYHAVGQNGATVYHKDLRLLASSDFEPALSSRLLQATRGIVRFIQCADDSLYVTERSSASLSYESRILSACTERRDLEAVLAGDELRCCKISFFGELARLNALAAELNSRFEGRIETFISDKDCLDVMPRSVSKGAGLSRLIRELGFRRDEVACIGDSFNDLPMFALTEHSYAMRDSRDEIRSRANHIIPSVADAIEQIIAHNRAFKAS
ncbi:Cof-type HAD-IIB family hydrolase [Paenibacillus arenilitoris]|uniref:Cof-type HAD-IIB family hydrolase n=1 Tax=Paenibacillus arenilitoris TaxID=2772299 RepID=A0A927H8D9_9BACL|nr:Cof-type HAD-IIB family hydrolase [Paenibacillus arenilitoris]MBD2870529.1 Cof-type HAD-IIB family hydrolase [Paenibacillus arenilitoris]